MASTREIANLVFQRQVRMAHPVGGMSFVTLCWCVLLSGPLAGASAQGFSIGANFTSVTLAESGRIPPDSMGSVGPEHVAVLINGRFSVHDKSGTVQLAKSLNQFWIDSGVTPAGSHAFDPRILYDSHSQHWFAVAVDNHGAANHFLLAVSTSSDPSQLWKGFQIDSDADDQHWADFPMLGINGDVVAVFANMLAVDCCGARGNLLVVPKYDLTNAEPTTVNATLIEDVAASFTSQPVVDHDNRPLPLPMLSGDIKPLNGFLARSDIVGVPELPSVVAFNLPILTEARNDPPAVDQPGPAVNVHAGQTRFSGSVIARGDSLWAVQGVEVNGRAAIEWYEISDGSGEILQNGIISDPSLGFSFPSIAVNHAKDVVIGFSGGGPDTFMSAYAAVGSDTGGATLFGSPVELMAGTSSYELLDSSGRNRWGDYSATVVDPVNDKHFWTFQEFAMATDEWAIQVTQIIVPEPSSATGIIFGWLVLILTGRNLPGGVVRDANPFP